MRAIYARTEDNMHIDGVCGSTISTHLIQEFRLIAAEHELMSCLEGWVSPLPVPQNDIHVPSWWSNRSYISTPSSISPCFVDDLYISVDIGSMSENSSSYFEILMCAVYANTMTICTLTKYATTIFRFITLFCGTHSIPQNIPGYSRIVWKYSEIFHGILSVPQNTLLWICNMLRQIEVSTILI